MASIPRFYVYLLARPNNKVFYVGKGQKKRVLDHEREAQSACPCHKCNVIRKIWRDGGEVQRYIVFTTDDEHEALAHERAQIALYGRKNLCNRTDGGEGPLGLTPEQRAKRGAASRGKPRHGYGDAFRRKLSEAQKGKKRGPRSEATRAKLKVLAQQRYEQTGWKPPQPNQEARARGGMKRRGQKQSPESIAKRTAKRIGQKMNVTPEDRQARADRIRRVGTPFPKGFVPWSKGVSPSEETRRKISESVKANPKSYGRKMTDSNREKLSAALSEYRRQHAAVYQLTSPDGEIHETNNLKQFCVDRSMKYEQVAKVVHNTGKYKGWRIKRLE